MPDIYIYKTLAKIWNNCNWTKIKEGNHWYLLGYTLDSFLRPGNLLLCKISLKMKAKMWVHGGAASVLPVTEP